MKHRRVLSLTGAVTGLVAGFGEQQDRGEKRSPSQAVSRAFDPVGRVESVRIGNRIGDNLPHAVSIWNVAEETRSMPVTFVDASPGGPATT